MFAINHLIFPIYSLSPYIYISCYCIPIYIYILKRFRQLCCQSVAADAVRAHSFVLLAKGLRWLQAQGLLIHNVDSDIQQLLNCTRIVCWTMLLLNTAPQFVGASNTLHKTNIVETQSHYVDTIGLGVDLCTGLMACSFTSVAQPQMLIKHSSNFAHSRLSRLNLLLRRDLLKIQRLLNMLITWLPVRRRCC